MCKEEDDENFTALLVELKRYEHIRQIYLVDEKLDKDSVNKHIDDLIQQDLMCYYRSTVHQQSKYGVRLRCAKQIIY
jgi:urease accessory protein UreH